MRAARNLAVMAGLLLLPAFVDGKDLQVASAWAPVPLRVDGPADTWSAQPRPLVEVPMVIAVQNDADFLYLCLRTSNTKLKKQLTMTGLTIWASGTANAGTKKGIGVRYPLFKEPSRKPRGDEEETPTPAAEASAPAMPEPLPEIELLGPSTDDRRRVEFVDTDPVAAALGDDSGVMVLQLRLPLKPSPAQPLAIGAGPGTAIALRLVTEAPKLSEAKRWKDRVGQYGVPEGPTLDMPDMPSPFSMWLQVTLATPPPSPTPK